VSITNIDLQRVSKIDLERLSENQVAEGVDIDYKRDLYPQTDKHKFLKAVSSFANTAGGHIVIGMEENNGLPTKLIGVEGDMDAEKLRLESLLRDCVEPRIIGLRMQSIPVSDGRNALVIRIPKSWNPPHAVVEGQSRLFFARNSAGAHYASVDELRAMFTAGATFLERARQFHAERLSQIHGGDMPVRLAGEGGVLVLHIIPYSAFGSETSWDPRAMQTEVLPPLWSAGYNGRFNVDGYLTTYTGVQGAQARASYLQVFRNGIIESVAGVQEQGTWHLYATHVEGEVVRNVRSCMMALSHTGVPPPLLIMLGGVRMHQTIVMDSPRGFMANKEPLRNTELRLPAVTIENYGEEADYAKALRPIFDAIWNAAGCDGSRSYDAAGNWSPHGRA
jgi:hypothetical protein